MTRPREDGALFPSGLFCVCVGGGEVVGFLHLMLRLRYGHSVSFNDACDYRFHSMCFTVSV